MLMHVRTHDTNVEGIVEKRFNFAYVSCTLYYRRLYDFI